MSRAATAVWLALALALMVPGAGALAADTATPPLDTKTETETEVHYATLADSLASMMSDGMESGVTDGALAEAEVLAMVAEELLVEGDGDLAAELLLDAIALFSPEGAR